jgi:hypothetical protein
MGLVIRGYIAVVLAGTLAYLAMSLAVFGDDFDGGLLVRSIAWAAAFGVLWSFLAWRQRQAGADAEP